MTFALTYIFIFWMLISAFMQAENNPEKNIISPGLTAACGVLVLIGSLTGTAPARLGFVLAIALLLLAASDFTFERSTGKESLFPLAVALGVISGFTIGIMINLVARIPLVTHIIFAVIAIIATILIYRYLDVSKDMRIPIFIYLIQAVILLTGGLASLYAGHTAFGIWGITIFITDSLVGIRAFPSTKHPIKWLTTRRILFLIIVLYYAAQYALVTWAL
jgi:hypothetical protein